MHMYVIGKNGMIRETKPFLSFSKDTVLREGQPFSVQAVFGLLFQPKIHNMS